MPVPRTGGVRSVHGGAPAEAANITGISRAQVVPAVCPCKEMKTAPWAGSLAAAGGIDGFSLRAGPLGPGDIWLVQGLCLWLQMYLLKYIWDRFRQS